MQTKKYIDFHKLSFRKTAALMKVDVRQVARWYGYNIGVDSYPQENLKKV